MALSTEQMMLIEQRVTNERKSVGVAYLLWFFLGGLGGHRFYMGKTGTAIAQLVLIVGGLILLPVMVGIPMLAVGAIWSIVDAFLIPGMVRASTDEVRMRLTSEMSMAQPTFQMRAPA